MISIQEALRLVLDGVRTLEFESAPLAAALGRACAEDISSTEPVPARDRAARDGLAVRAWDVIGASELSPIRLRLLPTAHETHALDFHDGCAVRVEAGAILPKGADAVVALSGYSLESKEAGVLTAVQNGDGLHPAGEDLAPGRIAVRTGEELSALHIAMLTAMGRSEIRVGARPRVAVFHGEFSRTKTGGNVSEEKMGGLFSSLLFSCAEISGAETFQPGDVPDNAADFARILGETLKKAEIVIVPVGPNFDRNRLLKDAMKTCGAEIIFDSVAQNPGQSMVYGRRGHHRIIGLPDAPVSAFVCFQMYVRPLLRRLQGFSETFLPHAFGRFETGFQKADRLAHLMLVSAASAKTGYIIHMAGSTGLGRLADAARGNAVALIPSSVDKVELADLVKFWLLT